MPGNMERRRHEKDVIPAGKSRAVRQSGRTVRSASEEKMKEQTKGSKVIRIEEWREKHMDYLVRGTAGDGYIRAFAATTKNLVEEARQRHNSSPVATAACGRLLTAGAMMGQMLKGEQDLLTLIVRGDGPLQGITVTADAMGQVKGFAYQPQVVLPASAAGKLDVGRAVGHGTLTVVRDQGLKDPYSSQVELQTGELGDDLSYYFAVSEQVPSTVGLGVLMNKNNTVRQAGGFLIQLMPGYSDELVDQLEQKVLGTSSVTSLLDQGMTPEDMLAHFLGDMHLEILDRKPLSFHCGCSKEHVAKVLLSLGEKELKEMISEGKPVTLTCHFCGNAYTYSVQEMQMLLDAAKEQGKIRP